MIDLGTVLRVAAILTVTVVLSTCSSPPNPALKSTFGDGTYVAGKQIQSGTYLTQNLGPHTKTKKCAWALKLVDVSGDNSDVILASSGDVGEQPQKVFIPGGRKITSKNCGVWEKTSSLNETD